MFVWKKKLTVTLAHAKIALKVYDSLKQKTWCGRNMQTKAQANVFRKAVS